LLFCIWVVYLYFPTFAETCGYYGFRRFLGFFGSVESVCIFADGIVFPTARVFYFVLFCYRARYFYFVVSAPYCSFITGKAIKFFA